MRTSHKDNYSGVAVSLFRPKLYSVLGKRSSPLTVRRAFSTTGLFQILPTEIEKSNLFLGVFSHLILALPYGCQRICLYVSSVDENNARVHRFEVAIAELATKYDGFRPPAPSAVVLDSLFHQFTQSLDGDGLLSSSVTKVSQESHKLRIEPIISEDLTVEDLTADDCCAICLSELHIGNQVYRTPCSHLYHKSCLCRWLENARSCPSCLTEPVHQPHHYDRQIWTFSG